METSERDWQTAVKYLYIINKVIQKYPSINFRDFSFLNNNTQNRSAAWLAYYKDLCYDVFNNWLASHMGITKELRHRADYEWLIEKYGSEPTLKHLMSVIALAGYNDYEVFGLYKYGSRVYGCANEASDFDYILVVDKPVDKEEIGTSVNINVYSLVRFLEKLTLHDIDALECACLSKKDMLINRLSFNDLIIRKPILRRSVSEKASHSFVKAKKKLTIEKDFNPYIGKKSLFHSLRIINFGTQIAQHGRIIDYSSANNFWNEIVNNPINDWQYYKDKYQPVYNSMMTAFRKLAPKE